MLNSRILPKDKMKDIYEILVDSLKEEELFLVFMDGNGIKHVNDAHGHLMGDLVIKTMLDSIVMHLKEDDYLFRFGGDEFVVLLLYKKTDDAKKIVYDIQYEIRSNDKFKKNNLGLVSISAGMVKYCKKHKPSLDRLIHVADMLMYMAKKNSPTFFSYTEDLSLNVNLDNYTRGLSRDEVIERHYFDSIFRAILTKFPDIDANMLKIAQRKCWKKHGNKLLKNFSFNKTLYKVLDFYNFEMNKKEAA